MSIEWGCLRSKSHWDTFIPIALVLAKKNQSIWKSLVRSDRTCWMALKYKGSTCGIKKTFPGHLQIKNHRKMFIWWRSYGILVRSHGTRGRVPGFKFYLYFYKWRSLRESFNLAYASVHLQNEYLELCLSHRVVAVSGGFVPPLMTDLGQTQTKAMHSLS